MVRLGFALVLAAGCRPEVVGSCARTQWSTEVEAAELAGVCGIAGSPDIGVTVYADAPLGAVFELDEAGELERARDVEHPGSPEQPSCQGLNLGDDGVLWVTSVEPSGAAWAHRLRATGFMASAPLPFAEGQLWTAGPGVIAPGGAAVIGGSFPGGGAALVRVDTEIRETADWRDLSGSFDSVQDLVVTRDGRVLAAARQGARTQLLELDANLGGVLRETTVSEADVRDILSDGADGVLVLAVEDDGWSIHHRGPDGEETWRFDAKREPPTNGLTAATDGEQILVAADATDHTDLILIAAEGTRDCGRTERLRDPKPQASSSRGEGEFIVAGENDDGVWIATLEL